MNRSLPTMVSGSGFTRRPDRQINWDIAWPWPTTGPDEWRLRCRHGLSGRLAGIAEPIDDGVAFALEMDRLRRVEGEVGGQPLVGGCIDLDHAGGAFAGNPAGQVDGIAPQVVDEFLFADDAGNDRP